MKLNGTNVKGRVNAMRREMKLNGTNVEGRVNAMSGEAVGVQSVGLLHF